MFFIRLRTFKIILVTLMILGGLAGGLYYLTHYYDPAQVIYKRMKADSPYVFEEIAPHFLRTDPADLIPIQTAADAEKIRKLAIEVIWGAAELPSRLPDAIDRDIEDAHFVDMENLERIDRLRLKMTYDVPNVSYHFIPEKKSGHLVIVHQGYAGTFHDLKHVIAAYLGQGHAVIALNFLGYGENRIGYDAFFPRFGWYEVHTHKILYLDQFAMRFFYTPVIAAINYARESYDYAVIDMMGFSAGGWETMVASAVDPRIRRSYPVAGSYPLYLRNHDEAGQSVPPQYYAPLLHAMNYLETFVLGSWGEDRGQLQIFNRFDRCCFRNVKGLHYAPAVEAVVNKIGPGRFKVVLDETHADHKVSDFAIETIIKDMARP